MTLQYLRHVRLTAKGKGGGFVVNPDGSAKHQLKIAFAVEMGISSTQNEATIEIYNLSEGHRSKLGKELDDITLEAGYAPPGGSSNIGIIAAGQIRDVKHTRSGPDIVTIISIGDGDKAVRSASVAETLDDGKEPKDAIEVAKKALTQAGVKEGEIKLPDNLPKFLRPYTMFGSAKRELDVLGRGFGFYWYIQHGALEIVPADGVLGGSTPTISPETGMIGVPAVTDNGVEVSCLLNPELRIGRKVKIESKVLEMNAANGEYRISAGTFSGDNRDGDFTTTIVGESIKGDKVDQGEQLEPTTLDSVSPVNASVKGPQ